MTYGMKEACRAVGMTYEALKFYCNQGLVPNVKRDANNRRVFDDRDIAWIERLTCLKSCGMSIQEMKTFIALCARGRATLPERKAILARKREELLSRVDRLNESIAYIDRKQRLYDGMLQGTIPYADSVFAGENDGGQGSKP